MKDMTEEEMIEEYKRLFDLPGVLFDPIRTNRGIELLMMMDVTTRQQMADWHLSEIGRILTEALPNP